MPDTNYSIEVTPSFPTGLGGNQLVIGTKSTTGVDIVITTPGGSGTTLGTNVTFDWVAIEQQ